jgi:hypothetical protein
VVRATRIPATFTSTRWGATTLTPSTALRAKRKLAKPCLGRRGGTITALGDAPPLGWILNEAETLARTLHAADPRPDDIEEKVLARVAELVPLNDHVLLDYLADAAQSVRRARETDPSVDVVADSFLFSRKIPFGRQPDDGREEGIWRLIPAGTQSDGNWEADLRSAVWFACVAALTEIALARLTVAILKHEI